MRWSVRGRRDPGGGTAELDARLSESWAAAAAAVGQMLDLPAGRQALLAGSGRFPDEAADPQAPAGLRDRTARPSRRGRALRPVAVLSAALAAGAVALLTVVLRGTRQHGIDPTGYVVRHVSDALSAAEPGQIAQMTVTTRSVAPPSHSATAITAEEWSYRGRWRLVTNAPAGHPVYDEGATGSPVYTLVNYESRTWARQSGLGRPAALLPLLPGAPGCGPSAAVPLLFPTGLPGIGSAAGSLPSTVARELRTAVSCGALAVTGRQRVDGAEAIELASRPGSPVIETIWVSPGTYLPVRAVVRPARGQLGPWQTADITWLPPAAQNLAKLTVPIPAGYRRVPLATAVSGVAQRMPSAFAIAPQQPSGPRSVPGQAGPP